MVGWRCDPAPIEGREDGVKFVHALYTYTNLAENPGRTGAIFTPLKTVGTPSPHRRSPLMGYHQYLPKTRSVAGFFTLSQWSTVVVAGTYPDREKRRVWLEWSRIKRIACIQATTLEWYLINQKVIRKQMHNHKLNKTIYCNGVTIVDHCLELQITGSNLTRGTYCCSSWRRCLSI